VDVIWRIFRSHNIVLCPQIFLHRVNVNRIGITERYYDQWLIQAWKAMNFTHSIITGDCMYEKRYVSFNIHREYEVIYYYMV